MITAQKIDYRAEITELKRELNAVLLAHYYQESEIQDLADFVGDSLELSRRAASTASTEVTPLITPIPPPPPAGLTVKHPPSGLKSLFLGWLHEWARGKDPQVRGLQRFRSESHALS